jgi:hypothetical protein
MSRGLGKVQRQVLDTLGTNMIDPMTDFDGAAGDRYQSWTTVLELATALGDGGEPSRALVESVRRAVLKLQAAELVEVLYIRREVASPGINSWKGSVNRMLLAARLPLEPALAPRWRGGFDRRPGRREEQEA